MSNFVRYLGSFILGLFGRKPTISAILKGSENIDRMRKEIKEVPPLLTGLLLEFCEERPDLSPFKESKIASFGITGEDGYNWKFNISNSQKSAALYRGNDPIFFYEFTRQPTLPIENVQIVHGQLEHLVGGFRKKFPFMDIQLNPFIQASDYSFS